MNVKAKLTWPIRDVIRENYFKYYRTAWCGIYPSEWKRSWWRPTGWKGRLMRWLGIGKGAVWPGPGRRPRACARCGSIHPDDAINLVKLGWDVDGTASIWTGEAMLIPPGREFKWNRSRLSPKSPGATATPEPNFFPQPLITLRHFTPKQRNEFNRAVFPWIKGGSTVGKARARLKELILHASDETGNLNVAMTATAEASTEFGSAVHDLMKAIDDELTRAVNWVNSWLKRVLP